MFNIDVRDAIKGARLFNYQIAGALGIAETSFSRKELPEDEKERIFKIIDELAQKGA